MPAGKSRNFPTPGSHLKCRTCEVSLICLSGRRRFGHRFWCNTCRGVYYADLDQVIRCVVFRNKRGRYQQRRQCPACSAFAPRVEVVGRTPRPDPKVGKGHGRIVEGITHRDADAWKTNQLAL